MYQSTFTSESSRFARCYRVMNAKRWRKWRKLIFEIRRDEENFKMHIFLRLNYIWTTNMNYEFSLKFFRIFCISFLIIVFHIFNISKLYRRRNKNYILKIIGYQHIIRYDIHSIQITLLFTKHMFIAFFLWKFNYSAYKAIAPNEVLQSVFLKISEDADFIFGIKNAAGELSS